MMMYNIHTIDLCKYFPPNIVALDKINIRISKFPLALLGPNGSGKTTFLGILCGLKHPTSGSLYINNFEPYKERNKAFGLVSFMYDKPDFPLRIKIRELIEILVSLNSDKENKLWRFVDELGLNDFLDQSLGELSSGQSQLVGLLTAISVSNGLVVLDEPISHLDLLKRNIVMDLLSKIEYLVFTTHVPEEAEAIANYIVILNEGRVIWAGDMSQMYRDNVYEVYLADSSNLPRSLKDSILYRFGRVVLAKSNEDELSKLYRKGLIIGFRRSGVKHEYIKALDRGKMVR